MIMSMYVFALNLNLWLHFDNDISNFLSAELPDNGNEIYLVSMEENNDEQ